MTLENLLEITEGIVEICMEDSLHYIYQGFTNSVPEELLKYKVKEIHAGHYYPYMSNGESIDCLEIEIFKLEEE